MIERDQGPVTVEGQSPLPRLGRALLFIHLLFSPLLFKRGLVEVFEYPKSLLLATTAILLSAGFLSHKAWQKGKEEPGGRGKGEKKRKGKAEEGPLFKALYEPIPLGMLLFLASAFFSTLFSISPRTSLFGEHENFIGLITIASCTILYFGTKALCQTRHSCRTLLMATGIAMACMILYGTAQATGLDPFTWKRTALFSTVTRIFGTMGHPNHLAAFLVMGLPILSLFRIRALHQRSWTIGLFLIAIELLAAVLIVFSFSRGAWAAMVVMAVSFSIGMAAVAEKKQVILWTLLPWIIGLVVGAASFSTLAASSANADARASLSTTTNTPTGRTPHSAVATSLEEKRPSMGAVGAKENQMTKGGNAAPVPTAAVSSQPLSGPHPLWERLMQMGISDLTQGTRWPIWTAAFAMFLDNPLFGVGLDCFRLAFMEYRPLLYWFREWGGTPTRAHNEFLNILATQGGLGAMAALIITSGLGLAFLRVLSQGTRSLREERALRAQRDLKGGAPPVPARSLYDPILPLALFAGIVAFYVQNLFSFTVIGTGTLFITYSAMLSCLSKANVPEGVAPFQKRGPVEGISMGNLFSFSQDRLLRLGLQGVIWMVASGLLYLLVYQPLKANILFSKTVFDRALAPQTAVTRLEEVVRLNPNKDLYFHHLGSAFRKASRDTRDAALKKEYLNLARQSYQQAIDLVPRDANHFITLANLLLVMSKESPPLASTQEVLSAIRKALKLDPHNANFYVIGADMAIAFGDRNTASRWALKCADLYPHFAPPQAQLGFIALIEASISGKNNNLADVSMHSLKAMDHFNRSLPMFWAEDKEKAEVAKKNLAKATLFLAKSQEQLGKFDGARAAYLQLLEAEPDNKEGLLAYESFKKRRGEERK